VKEPDRSEHITPALVPGDQVDEKETSLTPSSMSARSEDSSALDSEVLREFDDLYPGAAKAIVDNALAEAEHDRLLEIKEADHREWIDVRASNREGELNKYRILGQSIAGSVMIFTLAVIAYGMFLGIAPAHFALVLATAAILIGTLLGRNTKDMKKDVAELRSVLHQLRSYGGKKLGEDRDSPALPPKHDESDETDKSGE